MIKVWADRGWEDYLHWQQTDRKILRRINLLIKEIERTPFKGLGKPEPLKHEWQGYWSRRIDEMNRLIYRVEEEKLLIAQCRAHYDD